MVASERKRVNKKNLCCSENGLGEIINKQVKGIKKNVGKQRKTPFRSWQMQPRQSNFPIIGLVLIWFLSGHERSVTLT